MKTKKIDSLGVLIIVLVIVVLANIGYSKIISPSIFEISEAYIIDDEQKKEEEVNSTEELEGDENEGVEVEQTEENSAQENLIKENSVQQPEVVPVVQEIPEQIPTIPDDSIWGWPTDSSYVITSYYGYRWGRLHGGIDISGTGFGSPIYSVSNGTVIKTNNNCSDTGYYGNKCGGEYGNYVQVLASNGKTVLYAHMKSDIQVSEGQAIVKGQVIGYMGMSGSATGPHVHFEVRDIYGNRVNPCGNGVSC